MIVASILDDLSGFFSNLSNVHLGPLAIALACFLGYLSLRALAFTRILQEAYPHTRVPYRNIWGAYLSAYGFNNVIPARGGDVLKLYLVKTSIPGATYPTIGAALLVEGIFDLCAGTVAVTYAILAGLFPSPPSWVSLDSVDLSFVVSDGRRTLFLITATVVALLVIFSLVALRVRTFWASVRQGFAAVRDRRRYLRRIFAVQAFGWLVRATAFFFLLKAFGVHATPGNVFLVLCANAVAAIFPFTPGGAGVVQAMLLELLKGSATVSVIAAFGVGQQAVIAIFTLGVGFLALAFVFRIRSFREVIERGRADREAERAAKLADVSAAAATAEASPLASSPPHPAGPAPGTPPVPQDWLEEELAVDRARAERRGDRWRRRRGG